MFRYIIHDGVTQWAGRRSERLSLRLDSKTYEFIKEYRGKTMSDKVINIVFDFTRFAGKTDSPQKNE